LREGSEALQCNLASLFHFWGIHPSAGLSTELSSLSPCDGALERLTTYLDTAPRTNEDLRLFHQLKTDVDQNQVKFQIYDPLLETFDHSYGQQIRDIGASILATYFDVDLDQVPSTPVLNTAVFNHTGSNDTITFAWTTSVDPEGHKTPTADWNNIKQYPGLFAEFESDKFMITVPTSQIQNFDQPDLLLQRWDRIMDIFQIIHGRPLSRVRSEAYMLDSASAVVGSYPGGYRTLY